MLTISSGDLFKAALRKCGGIIAEGESVSADLMEDTRLAFNTMLDAWSAERLSVYTNEEQIFTWAAGDVVQTIGPTGDVVGVRPVWVDDSSYFKDTSTGVSYPLEIISEADYNGIAVKTVTSTYPKYLVVGAEMPNASLYVFPIPTTSVEFHLISVEELAQVPDLFTDLTFPPGYQRAFTFNLAVEMCIEMGLEPPATVKKIAVSSKRVLKAHNAPKDVLEIPAGLLNPGRFNIYSGE